MLWPTLPPGGELLGGYGGAVLHLARALRDRFPADTAPDRLRSVVGRWLDLAERASDRVVPPGERAAVLRAFERTFPEVTTPLSQSRPMLLMREAAAACPGNKTAKLLAAGRALAASLGGEFDLSGRTAGAVVGLDGEKGRLKLEFLVRRGDLVLVERSPGRWRGHRYRLGPATG